MLNQELYQFYIEETAELYDSREADSVWQYVREHVQQASEYLQMRSLEDVVARLKKGEPIQYITGTAYFYGLTLNVGPQVLVPRPETEELVFHALKLLGGGGVVLDIGTGSGCIALALKDQRQTLHLYACDISSEALEVARANALKLGLEVDFFEADFTKVADFDHLSVPDMIISNPPYIMRDEQAEMTSNTRFEPDIALYSEKDPAWAYHHLAEIATVRLRSGGHLLAELNEFRVDEIRSAFHTPAFSDVEIILDMSGKPRIIKARKN